MERFFAISPGTLKPHGLIKMFEGERELTLYYWNSSDKTWVENAELIRYLMGDQPDIQEITSEEAEKLLKKL